MACEAWRITYQDSDQAARDAFALAARLAAENAELRRISAAPSIEAARAMGEKGGSVVEDERIAFEAWMRGHNWRLDAKWNGITYRGDTETGGRVCQDAIRTRQLWAAWRDRAALARNG